MTQAGRAHVVAPIEKATTGGGEIVTARAVAIGSRIIVQGSVGRQPRPGWVHGAYSHVDVLVLNSQRRVVESHTERFSPTLVPATLRGFEGRSHYSTALRVAPSAGSVIRVVFHNVPRKQCKFYVPEAG